MHPLAAAAHAVRESAAFRRLLRAAGEGGAGQDVRGAPGVVMPLAVALLAEGLKRPAWLVTPDIMSARRAAEDLEALSARVFPGGVEALVLPPLEGDPYALVGPHDNVQRERVATFEALREPQRAAVRVLVTPARSLLLPTPPPGRAARQVLELRVGDELPPLEAVEQLMRAGYVSTDVVAAWGEYSHRGAVLDAWAPDDDLPVRAEYWGDEITELRSFDPVTQRSVGALEMAQLGAVKEAAPDSDLALRLTERIRGGIKYGIAPRLVERLLEALGEHGTFPGMELLRWAVEKGVSPGAHVPEAVLVVDRPDLVEREVGEAFREMEAEWSEELRPFLPGPGEVLRPVDEILAECARASVRVADVAWSGPGAEASVDLGARPSSKHGGDLARYLRELRKHLEGGGKAGIVFAAPGRLQRMREVLGETGLGERVAWVEPGAEELDEIPAGRIALGLGLIGAGAATPPLLVHSEADLFGDLPPPRKERKRRKSSAAFASDLRDLKVGDLVVHADHGIGRFLGLQSMGSGEQARDFMLLQYLEDAKLYVPLDRLDLVERYSGVAGHLPRLDRLGGASWEKVKRTVKKAMLDMTRELLDLYAARQTTKGFRFSQDGEWQREFEAAFPHEETEDQLRAIQEVKDDMTSEKPMDRLVVGDVGFGKTEVALRAAFKAVMDGKQVALLAPTTVLALQHHATFVKRCSAWPVRVEQLSRFRTAAEAARVVAGLKAGEVDVVVGTHRILSKDVGFKDLGLLVVDEEQRFGVRHKERIKALRKTVDVLTLTATPIPRTLSMALGGLRDMSVIETPPINRHAIQTYVLPFSPEVLAAACRQELDRGGQVYVVHDKVQGLYSLADLVRKLVPGAKVGIAHGQLPERELEQSMLDFLRGDVEILACTTVIENGLDIPRANTMVINRADRFGLAQLYQLRGRVGRSDRQAHAYLFVPPRAELTPEARQRLAALQEFTELGAGFRIAALDLEIRGAGSLLGGEQHGHVAALGFDMYVKLLEDTVRELKGEAAEAEFRAQLTVPLELRLPPSYVPDDNQRLMVYKRFATLRDPADVEPLLQEIVDRHGAPPASLERIAEHARLRLRLERLRIASLEATSRAIKLKFAAETRVHPQALMRLLEERAGSSFSPDGVLTVKVEAGMEPIAATWELLRELG